MATVGGFNPGEGNTVANNGGDGVRVSDPTATSIRIRGNSIHSNGGKGIALLNGANNNQVPPVINSISPVSGTSCINCDIDIYSDNGDEGRTYEGTAIAGASGTWTFNGSVSGPNVTAISTNATNNTSEFSAPFALPATPTPSPTQPPTPTPTDPPSVPPTDPPSASPTAPGSPTSTPTFTPLPTPTPEDTITPVLTLGPGLNQGDLNCDGEINEDDLIFLLEFAAGVSDGGQPFPCPDLGEPDGETDFAWGDLNCDGVIDGIDALFVVLFKAGLQTPDPPVACTPLGGSIS
jgi:hypothetical protein